MCDLVSGSVTFTGPYRALTDLERIWNGLTTVRDYSLQFPQLQSFGELPSRRSFDYPASPGIARLFHEWGPGTPVAERLQVEMAMAQTPIFVEHEHHIGLSSGTPSSTGGRPGVAIDHGVLGSAATDAVIGSAAGHRVAVVDSGDLLGKPVMVDFTGGLAREVSADDEVGHGTAVAELIRSINPHAEVTALRVVNSQRGTSYELLCAMTYAMWSGEFDLINVSLSAQSTTQCMTVLGGSLNMVLDVCRNNGVSVPQIVAAAGNATTGQAFGYPARLPGATIVTAWDFDGVSTDYNVAVPPSLVPINATGGDSSRTFGAITHSLGDIEPMFGTSYAAAVATALLVP